MLTYTFLLTQSLFFQTNPVGNRDVTSLKFSHNAMGAKIP